MAVGQWTIITGGTGFTGTPEYFLGADGLVRFRGLLTLTQNGPSSVAPDPGNIVLIIPAEAIPHNVPIYLDWTGGQSDLNCISSNNVLYMGQFNLTGFVLDLSKIAWLAATIPAAAPTLLGAIYDRLRADLILQGLLATYAGTPAVFTGPPIPEDAALPAIIVEAADDESPDDTKTTTGRVVTRALTIYADATGDVAAVEAVAARVVALFHRVPMAGGWKTIAYGPAEAPTDGTLYGRRIVLEMSS